MLARVLVVVLSVVVLGLHAAQPPDPMPSTSTADADTLPPPAGITRCLYRCRFCRGHFQIPTQTQRGLYDRSHLNVCDDSACLGKFWALDGHMELPVPEPPIGTWLPPTSMLPTSSYPGAYRRPRVTRDFVVGVLGQLRQGRPIDAEKAMTLLAHAANVLNREPNVVEINLGAQDGVKIVGNIHCQFHDLCNILELAENSCRQNRYIFNGGFVNGGDDSVQCVLALLAMKVFDPQYGHRIERSRQI